MISSPPVAVIMSVFNDADVVGAAIQSILQQSFRDFELVVVDDGSTDATPDVIQRFASADNRVRALRNETNRGLAASLNRAWRASRSPLIARMDSDDTSHADRFQKQVDFLHRTPDVDVLGTAAEVSLDSGTEIVRRPEDHKTLMSRMYKEMPFFHPSVMMRRHVLEVLGGYDERLRRAQDADLWLRAYRRFRFHNLQEPLITYKGKRVQSLQSILYGTYVLARAASRDDVLLVRGWYALRFLAVGLVRRVI